MTDVNLCSQEQEVQGEEINLCSSEQEDQEIEVNLCPSDEPPPGPCDNPPELFLSGTDAPVVGSNYTASGGVSPYSYSFSGGTISASGQITAITGCGLGSVSATDSCGQSASIEVRLPSGQWVMTASNNGSSNCSTMYTGNYSETLCTYGGNIRIVNNVRYRKYETCFQVSPSSCSVTDAPHAWRDPCFKCIYDEPGGGYLWWVYTVDVFVWECNP